MSIYIKDMRLPSADELTGSVKVLLLYSDGMIIDNANGTPIGQAIELPEHGDLVDRGALGTDDMAEAAKQKWIRSYGLLPDKYDEGFMDGVASMVDAVNAAEPIIPADGGETWKN